MPVQEFCSENDSKEMAFQAAITAVQQASSEQELDARVGSALSNLDLSVSLLPRCCCCFCMYTGYCIVCFT